MIGNLPDQCWESVTAKKFKSNTSKFDVTGLSGDDAEIYRITVRHNNNAGERDQIRFNINQDYTEEKYEAVESYMSAEYKFGDRKTFTALSEFVPRFEDLWERGRSVIPKWEGWELFHPGWRVLRNSELGYLSFGMPDSGTNALFGQGILLAASGGPRSMIRTCAEQHPNGNLLTIGRYTYKDSEDEITELNFSANDKNGIGTGSFIFIERLSLPSDEELNG